MVDVIVVRILHPDPERLSCSTVYLKYTNNQLLRFYQYSLNTNFHGYFSYVDPWNQTFIKLQLLLTLCIKRIIVHKFTILKTVNLIKSTNILTLYWVLSVNITLVIHLEDNHEEDASDREDIPCRPTWILVGCWAALSVQYEWLAGYWPPDLVEEFGSHIAL